MRHKSVAVLAAIMFGISGLFPLNGVLAPKIFAEDMLTEVVGRVYTFGEKDHYDYSNSNYAELASLDTTYGVFTIGGDLCLEGKKDGVPAYFVNGSTATLTYSYNDAILNADENKWHLVDDKSKIVAGIDLGSNIKKGVVILQTSKDGKSWFNDVVQTNVFEDVPVQSESLYAANSVQLANGCYYRLIVAYETARTVGQNKLLFVKTDVVEYKKTAEVYEFYLYNIAQTSADYIKSQALGSAVNTGKDNGYSGSSAFDLDDPHYGWQIGDFFVSGYTRETYDSDGSPIFLKNVGDQVTLWFNLKQDIDALNGESIKSINADVNGYDQYFQTAKGNIGRGTLIVRYTDESGVRHDPEIYTNYLAANATTSADTVVRLFEEGDYEVALDYEIKTTPRKVGSVEVIPEYTNYRIFFTFKVRNGNCMVYPFDILTKEELTDESITQNGFKLDMAKSRYLIIDVTRSDITMGANGYAEDIRFNKPAKDGDQYTDEGIYTFSVKNLYTGESTTKTIYVGSAEYIKALSVNKITVAELNNQLSQGGIVDENGIIIMPTSLEVQETESLEVESSVESINEPVDNAKTNAASSSSMPIVLGSIVVIGGIAVALMTKKKNGGE